MSALRQAWSALRLGILEPLDFSAEHWALLERLHENFCDRAAHTRLPIPIARFHAAATKVIHDLATELDDVRTDTAAGAADPMATWARRYDDDVDAMMGVLVPSAR